MIRLSLKVSLKTRFKGYFKLSIFINKDQIYSLVEFQERFFKSKIITTI